MASYDSVVLGVVASPGASPRGREHPRESFYYTLVFPACSSRELPRVSYSEACEMLRGVTASGSSHAIDELRAAWKDKFRSGEPQPQDLIQFSALQQLMKNVIVARFSALDGMTVQSRRESRTSGRLLVSFRPSLALLRATAERLKVRVPASSALAVGNEEEAATWNEAAAQLEIYRLFLAGKISADEAQIFACEDPGMWSRRLSALQRLAAFKPVQMAQQDVAYLPFRDLAALRYVYRQIDDGGESGGDVDGSPLSPFRVVDKIRLTKALIDAEFDCDALVERGLLDHHLCPHTHHTTDVDTSLDALRVQWGSLPSLRGLLYGLFRRNDNAEFVMDSLVHVRNYFGEQLALYFSFASFIAKAVRTLAILTLVLSPAALKVLGHQGREAVFCMCLCAFLGVVVRKWELHEACCAARWSGGTPQDPSGGVNPLLQLPRPQFRGRMRRSAVTLRMEPYFPAWKSLSRWIASSLVLMAVAFELGAGYATVVASDRFQELTAETSWRFNVALGVVALASKCLTPHLARCSQALTNWENHRLQRDYDSQLTFKFAMLQSVNCFGALWGLAFLRPLRCKLDECRFPTHNVVSISAWDQAARLLLIMLGLDVVLSLWGIRVAVWCWFNGDSGDSNVVSTSTATTVRERGGLSGPSAALLTTPPFSFSDIEGELALAPYEGVLFDYAQVLMPFGFVAWFAPLSPLTSCVLAWLVAVLQLRADAFKLCHETQRPFPIQTVSLGAWLGYLHVLRVGSVLHGTAFALMAMLDAPDAHANQRTLEQRVVVFGAAFALVGWVSYALEDPRDLAETRRLQMLRARQAALEGKYLEYLGTHLAATARAALRVGRVFPNGVPRYVVTGDKGEEDAAEELRGEWRQHQMRLQELEKEITQLRGNDGGKGVVGVLCVDVQGVSLLPVAAPIRSIVELRVRSGTGAGESLNDSARSKQATRISDQTANTSESKKSRSPNWHESFELAVASLDDILTLRVQDGGLILGTQRQTLGRAELAVDDVLARTSNSEATPRNVESTPTGTAIESKLPKPSPLSSSSSDEEKKIDPTSSWRRLSRRLSRRRRRSSRRRSLRVAEIPMATYELPLEVPEALRRARQIELSKRGPPRLVLRCGVELNELGERVVAHRHLREKIALLQSKEVQLSTWGVEPMSE